MLLIHYDENDWRDASDEEKARVYAGYDKLGSDLAAQGALIEGGELKHTSTARTVRMREGSPILSDGPFAETKEQLGGFMLVECADLDEATSIASRIPCAERGGVEVRPV